MTETVEQLVARMKVERPELFRVNSKYAPKLSFFDRCVFYGLFQMDFSIQSLCTAFGVALPTGRYMVRNSSPHYRDVRKEWADLGRERFLKEYVYTPIGEEWTKKAVIAKAQPELTEKQFAADRAASSGPNKRASQRKGPVTLAFGEIMGNCTLSFDVQWFDTPPPDADWVAGERMPGWYLVLTDGTKGWKPGVYGDNQHRMTSTSALQGFIKDTEATPL